MENNVCRCLTPMYSIVVAHSGYSSIECGLCGLALPSLSIKYKKCDKCRDKIPVVYKSECSENGFAAWRPDEYYQCAHCPDCGHKIEEK